MNAKTLKALKGSIDKWQKIVDGTGVDEGINNCPLCKLFNKLESPDKCAGCPVREKTGAQYCAGTPYIDYEAETDCGGEGSELADEYAEAELKFLQSLLPSSAETEGGK